MAKIDFFTINILSLHTWKRHRETRFNLTLKSSIKEENFNILIGFFSMSFNGFYTRLFPFFAISKVCNHWRVCEKEESSSLRKLQNSASIRVSFVYFNLKFDVSIKSVVTRVWLRGLRKDSEWINSYKSIWI